MSDNASLEMSRPDINEDDIAAVSDALRSGHLSIGPWVERFEEAMARYIGVGHAVAVNSGTSGLHLCMRMAGIGEGDEVVTSPFSFIASANCIVFDGGTPVFVDIDDTTLNIDPAAAEAAITERTRALLPVHVFGQPAAMADLENTSRRHSLSIIEDACEAIGAEFRGRKAGSFGRAAVFAFYPNKQMTTGEGGMVVTNDAAWADKMRSLRNQGRGAMGGWLDHEDIGYNYRLDEMSAALGHSQLSRIDATLELRRQVADRYGERLARIPEATPIAPAADTTRLSWFVYPVRLAPDVSRDAVADRLKSLGIPTRNYFPPIHLQPYYRDRFGFRRGQFPVTERAAQEILALPFHSRLSEAKVERVCRALQQAIGEVRR